MVQSQFRRVLGKIRHLISGLAIKSLTISAVFFVLSSSGSAVMEAQKTAGNNHPTTVPSEYIITPFGYFHPSCFKRLSHGDILQKDQGVIRHTDGTSDPLQVCQYPHYDRRGRVVSNVQGETDSNVQLKTMSPSISHSWIEAYATTTSTSYGVLNATWTVPASPTSNDDQTLFFFPGMVDTNDELSIIQPVLGWNSDYSDAWGIASWNCCLSGITYESSPVSVSSGDTILGTLQPSCFTGVESCRSWNIYTYDLTTGKSTSLTLSPSEGQTFNEVFAGAVEVYSVAQCSDYPPQTGIIFSGLELYDYKGNLIGSPDWSFINYSSGLTPQCNYTGNEVSAQEVELFL